MTEPEPDDRPVFPAEATHVSGRRFLAHLLDGVLVMVIFVAALVPILILEAVTGDGVLAAVITGVFAALAILWLFVGHLAWFVWQESKDGFTLGKRTAGIRVVTADGSVPSRGALWKRSIPLLIEYFYVLAFIGMMSSGYRRRFGDRWGDTYVIKADTAMLQRG